MKIRTKLLASHGILALCVAVICVFILIALDTTDRNRRRLEDSYEHLRQLNELTSDTNRMSEQIAELFSIGLSGQSEVTEVSRALLTRLDELHVSLRAEIAAASSETRRLREQEMLRRIGIIRDRTQQLSDLGDRLAAMLAAGQTEAARRLYAERVEDGLDDEISQVMRDATAADERRVLDAIEQWDRQTELLRFLAITAVALGTALAVGSALVMDRLVSRRIAALADAVDDLARGGGGRAPGRSAPQGSGGDELGHLATRFDQMARQIGKQQAELLAARDGLRLDVAERTASLSRRTAELETANARLTRINDTRTQFFADVSHELRTPLTVIRGQAEVALRQPQAGPDDLRRTMGQIVRRAVQMGRLVDDLLFLARSEAGVIGFSFRDTMMQEVLAEVVMDGGPQTRERDVTISLHQPSDPVMLRADPDRLRQAIGIVLDNALSHAPKGSTVTLDLRLHRTEARLSVADQGQGFSAEDGDRVFERFYRGTSRTARRGAGLGLPIARWLLQQHAGRIAIGQAETGARVEIALPLIPADDRIQEQGATDGYSDRRG
ncbi:ATP-binding protein [Paracoccus nototheniae]|uniref:histidine kinase n=1 Tax=Paracoccus nototheniae TaxID=2489002 RepID=A0ABW4E0J1_9RHOB|nr:ATP-binding protein [Paracoccus nototheniae]